MAAEAMIWCLATANIHTAQREHEIALQAAALLVPEKDLIVLPSDPSTRDYWEFCKEILELKEEQVVWTKGGSAGAFTLEDISPENVEAISAFMARRAEAGMASALVPFAAGPKFKAWAAALAHHKPKIVGEGAPGAKAAGHKGAMHRHIKRLAIANEVEKINASIRVPRGYTCSNCDDLLVAYQMLGAKEVVVKPVLAAEGEGTLTVSSPEELRLYDFPLGDAVLEEYMELDKAPDGILIATTLLAFPPGAGGSASPAQQPSVCDQILVGSTYFGLRTCGTPAAFQATAASWTRQLFAALCPAGETGFGSTSFMSVKGEPVLTSISTGALGSSHLPKLFQERHARDAHFIAWSFVPPAGLDVWTFWSRVLECDAGFTPGTSTSGVFPLVYLKGVAGQFIALGPSMAEVMRLRTLAEDLLKEADSPKVLELVSWKDSVRRIWCSGPRPEYRRETQRYNMPNRCIPLVRKGKDVIILPGGHEPTREYWEFCKEVLELSDDQVYWTSGKIYNLDDDISSEPELVSRLKALVISNPKDKFTLVPYAVTDNFERWAKPFSELGVTVFGEDLKWIHRYGHKGILHRHMRSLDQPSVLEQMALKVRVAIGYTCSTVEDLVGAYRLMGLKDVVIKPVYGAAGEGILFVSNEEQLRMYDFPMGDVSLEEFLDLDRAPDGVILSPAVHYMEGKLIGKGLVDQIMIGTSYGGWRISCVKKSFQKAATAMIDAMLQIMEPKGPGGFDFLSVKGLPVLTDVNTGRFNGAHTPKLFQDLYAKDMQFYCWKVKPSLALDIWSYWGRLQERGIAFTPGKSAFGVFPVTYLRGLSGTFVSFAETDEAAEALRNMADQCLTVMNAGSGPPLLNRFSVFKRSDITKNAHRRIWCQSPLAAQRQQNSADKDITPLRAVSLLRPGVDVILLPATEACKEMWEFARETLGLSEAQVLWVRGEGEDLDGDILADPSIPAALAKLVTAAPQDKFTLVPRSVTDDFQKWASPLVDLGCRVFGDKPEWQARYDHAGILHRRASRPAEPSRMEEINLGVRVPAGFTCSNTQDLLDAYAMLGGGEAVIKPQGGGTDGQLLVSSEQELKLYDFPTGDVALEENLKLDKAEDGIVICANLTYMAGECFGKGAMDQLIVGKFQSRSNFGMRPSVTSQMFQEHAAAATTMFLRAANPRGAGGFNFVSVGQEPVLCDVIVGKFMPEHFPKLFQEAYARDSVFLAWNFVPPAGLDVWTFWSRVLRKGLSFVPGSPTHNAGCYPLVFMRGMAGSFVAIGPSYAAVKEIRRQAEEILREPVALQQLQGTSFQASGVRRVWCFAAPARAGPERRVMVPARGVPLVRKGLDVVILPGGHEPTRELWAFMKLALDLADDQVIFTSGKAADLDADIDDTVIAHLKALAITHPDDRFAIIPTSASASFQGWVRKLGESNISVFGESLEFLERYGSRAVLHRHVARPDVPCELERLAEAAGAPLPTVRGWVCSTADDLVQAWRLLAVKEAAIRPLEWHAAEGTMKVSSEEQLKLYDFPAGDVLMEEVPAWDRAPDGMVLSTTVQYLEGVLLDRQSVDHIVVGAQVNGLRPTAARRGALKMAEVIAGALVAALAPRGPGGVDFRAVGGKPLVTDVCLGRFTGAHTPRLFVEQYAPGATFFAWRFKPPAALAVELIWQRLCQKGLAFQPGKGARGVFPICFLRGIEAYMIAIGTSELDTAFLHESALAMFKQEMKISAGPTPAPPAPRPAKKAAALTLLKGPDAIYTPGKHEGPERHLLLAGGKVVALLTEEAMRAILVATPDMQVVDATGLIAVPGFVDLHVHVTGGGGELGPASRTPEAKLSELVDGGMTTLVGVLGTDCVSRSLENLLVKVRGINAEGLTCLMYTGAYRVPVPTLTGSVRRDVMLIEPCIGVGEIAVSEHRGSQPTCAELTAVAAEARVGGMLSGKAGLCYVHMGAGQTCLEPLREVLKTSEIPISTFLPTHVDRSDALIADGIKWLQEGGSVDFTSRSIRVRKALQLYKDQGLPMERVSVSSDSYGSCPTFDILGSITKYEFMDTKALLRLLRNMHFSQGWPIEEILPLMTANPAAQLKMPAKGHLEVGSDADVLLLDRVTLNLKYVIAGGEVLKTPTWTQAGMCEKKSKKLRPHDLRGAPL